MIDALTSLTDLMVALMCFLFAHTAYKDYSYHRFRDRTWLWFFLFTGLAFMFGALYHGLLTFSISIVWLFVMICFGVALIFFMIGESEATFTRKTVFLLRFVYSVLFIGFAILSYVLDNFKIMLVVLSLGLLSVIVMSFEAKKNRRFAKYLVAGIMVAILSSVVQATNVSFIGMDHNVLFHTGLMLALILVFYSYRLTIE